MIFKSEDLSKAPSVKGIVIKQLKKIPDERDVSTICSDVTTRFLKNLEKYIFQ